MFSNPGVGTFLFATPRLLFRAFLPDNVFFQPSLSGAGWHKVEGITPDQMVEVLELTNAFAVMSYLRTNGIITTEHNE